LLPENAAHAAADAATVVDWSASLAPDGARHATIDTSSPLILPAALALPERTPIVTGDFTVTTIPAE